LVKVAKKMTGGSAPVSPCENRRPINRKIIAASLTGLREQSDAG
jgi:hypothetical protein